MVRTPGPRVEVTLIEWRAFRVGLRIIKTVASRKSLRYPGIQMPAPQRIFKAAGEVRSLKHGLSVHDLPNAPLEKFPKPRRGRARQPISDAATPRP